MKAAPPITDFHVLSDFVVLVTFDGMRQRQVHLKDFPLLGKAKRLSTDEAFLKSFTLVDGIPEWGGECLLGPEDLLEHSEEAIQLPATGAFMAKVKTRYRKK